MKIFKQEPMKHITLIIQSNPMYH